MNKPEEVSNAIWYLEKDKRYFLRESSIIAELGEAYEIASSLHFLADSSIMTI